MSDNFEHFGDEAILVLTTRYTFDTVKPQVLEIVSRTAGIKIDEIPYVINFSDDAQSQLVNKANIAIMESGTSCAAVSIRDIDTRKRVKDALAASFRALDNSPTGRLLAVQPARP